MTPLMRDRLKESLNRIKSELSQVTFSIRQLGTQYDLDCLDPDFAADYLDEVKNQIEEELQEIKEQEQDEEEDNA